MGSGVATSRGLEVFDEDTPTWRFLKGAMMVDSSDEPKELGVTSLSNIPV